MEWDTIAVNDEHEESDEAAENVSVWSLDWWLISVAKGLEVLEHSRA